MSPVSVSYWRRGFVAITVMMAGLLAAPWAPTRAEPAAACGDIIINEIKFKQTDSTDGGVAAGDEWVELYVVNAIVADTTVIVDDLETTTSGRFRLQFTVAAGTPAGKYLIIHDNASGSGEALPSGSAVNAIEFFGAGGASGSGAGFHLNDTGDNVLLTIDGASCEEVHWGTRGSDANIAPTTAAAITIAFGPASSVLAGESIQRSPNSSGSSFLRAGTGVPGATAVGSPTTMGHSNNIGPNAITLSSFAAAQQTPGFVLVPVLSLACLLAGAALARRRLTTI